MAARGAQAQHRLQQPVVGAQERVTVVLPGDDAPGRADAGIHHGHVHRARGKVPVGAGQPEARLDGPVDWNLVGEVHDLRAGKPGQDRALHDADEGALQAEVRREGDYRRHGQRITGRSGLRRG
jgi:hypothetical protein